MVYLADQEVGESHSRQRTCCYRRTAPGRCRDAACEGRRQLDGASNGRPGTPGCPSSRTGEDRAAAGDDLTRQREACHNLSML
eukprot:154857-Pyramimonas_sp.AAC.2